jgi:nitrogen regulatory protein PII
MKMILAFIKPLMLDEVMFALHGIEGLTGVSTSTIHGFGRDRTGPPSEGKTEVALETSPHARLEIVCRQELAANVVETIENAAHTGLRGDGKIYVLPVEDTVRISSGERGKNAV